MPHRFFHIFKKCQFRTLVLVIGAVYFLVMYLFHSDLQRARSFDEDEEWNRVHVGGGDDYKNGDQNRLSPIRLRNDDDVWNAFEKLRENQRLGLDGVKNEVEEKKKSNTVRPVKARLYRNYSYDFDDANIPTGCHGKAENFEFNFQQVAYDVFLFSAFWDSRANDFDNRHNGSFVRMIAIMRRTNRQPDLRCFFDIPSSSSSSTSSVNTSATYYEMCENHGKPYGGYIISCPVPLSIRSIPCSITVAPAVATDFSESFLEDSVKIRIRTIDPLPRRRNFTICVPPLFGTIEPRRMIEFLEVSHALGADRIILYDFSISKELEPVIEFYSNRRDLVSVIPWRLFNTVIDRGIWYQGQLIAIQDCLYRTMATSSYVSFNDLDEFIVPQNVPFWNNMVQLLDKPDRCAFPFQAAFFNLAMKDDDQVEELKGLDLDLQTMTLLMKSSTLDRVRTKCMVKPFLIFEKGIHHVSKPIWSHLIVHPVETNIARLHHYRICLNGMGMKCGQFEEDTTMLRYKKIVIAAVNSSKNAMLSLEG